MSIITRLWGPPRALAKVGGVMRCLDTKLRHIASDRI